MFGIVRTYSVCLFWNIIIHAQYGGSNLRYKFHVETQNVKTERHLTKYIKMVKLLYKITIERTNNMNYLTDIPLNSTYIKMIIDAIPNAYFLYQEHIDEQKFPTDNGREGEIWDYINKCVAEVLPADKFQVVVMNRGRWKFLGIYDRDSKYLYTLMREKNLGNLRKTISEHLFHYINALSKLNDKLADIYQTVYHQMTMFGVGEYDEQGEEILDKILSAMIRKINGEIERYVLISFDVDRKGHVNEIKGIVPAKGLEYYKEESWTSYITEEYVSEKGINQEIEISENAILLQRRPRIKRISKKEDTKKKENE